MEAVNPINVPIPIVGYRTKFGSSTSNDVSAQKEYTKLDPLGPVPWMGSLHLIIPENFVHIHRQLYELHIIHTLLLLLTASTRYGQAPGVYLDVRIAHPIFKVSDL